jgi:RNase H-fold protein (predicted Holliday junction resolvase)
LDACSTSPVDAPEQLRDRLAQLEEEHATLRSELAAFQSDYLRLVGVVDLQVQELEAKVLAIVAARTGAVDDAAAADAAERRFRETTTAMSAIPAPAGPPPDDELKTLFRDAAKRMHPDLVHDPGGREHAEAFMKRLNEAYGAGDAEAIGNLVRQWETSPFASGLPASPDGGSTALAAAVADAQRRLEEARDSDLARLMEEAFTASMAGRDLLAELRAQAELALAAARERLAALDV